MSDLIRLVCPDCDTVHRVNGVTLGKLYRCKKCKTGLITMSPAIISCPDCGKEYPPAHVEVSRLITCPDCEDAPLMELSFPPPVRPVREVQASGSARDENDPPSDSMPYLTEAEPTRRDSERLRGVSGSQSSETIAESGALAVAGQEDRAVSALKRVMEDVQAPLIEEIERTRASVPVWMLAVVSLPVLALIGWLFNAYLRSGNLRDEVAAAREKSKSRAAEVERLNRELFETEQALTKLLAEHKRLQQESVEAEKDLEKLEAYKRSLKSMSDLVKKWQSIATDNYQLSEALKQQLRALGHDPDTVRVSRKDETP